MTKKCAYCNELIRNGSGLEDDVIAFCNSVCVWMKFQGEQMLKDGKFPELDRK